ncbi:MAG: hypothetical protein ACJAS1_000579 [Oleiphilaceae bacterium]|jgi:hypothetical protein
MISLASLVSTSDSFVQLITVDAMLRGNFHVPFLKTEGLEPYIPLIKAIDNKADISLLVKNRIKELYGDEPVSKEMLLLLQDIGLMVDEEALKKRKRNDTAIAIDMIISDVAADLEFIDLLQKQPNSRAGALVGFGSVVCAEALKITFPDAELVWITSETSQNLIEQCGISLYENIFDMEGIAYSADDWIARFIFSRGSEEESYEFVRDDEGMMNSKQQIVSAKLLSNTMIKHANLALLHNPKLDQKIINIAGH